METIYGVKEKAKRKDLVNVGAGLWQKKGDTGKKKVDRKF